MADIELENLAESVAIRRQLNEGNPFKRFEKKLIEALETMRHEGEKDG